MANAIQQVVLPWFAAEKMNAKALLKMLLQVALFVLMLNPSPLFHDEAKKGLFDFTYTLVFIGFFFNYSHTFCEGIKTNDSAYYMFEFALSFTAALLIEFHHAPEALVNGQAYTEGMAWDETHVAIQLFAWAIAALNAWNIVNLARD